MVKPWQFSRALNLGTLNFVLVLGLANAQSQARNDTSGRRQSSRVFKLYYRMPLDEHRQLVSEMQKTCWAYWKNKQAGSLSFRFTTAEGNYVNGTLVFENDDRNEWRVRIERKEFRNVNGHKLILSRTNLAYSMRRINGKKRAGDENYAFDDSADLQPGKYDLEFKSKDGEVVFLLEPDNTAN